MALINNPNLAMVDISRLIAGGEIAASRQTAETVLDTAALMALFV
jgi:hypothetical protein